MRQAFTELRWHELLACLSINKSAITSKSLSNLSKCAFLKSGIHFAMVLTLTLSSNDVRIRPFIQAYSISNWNFLMRLSLLLSAFVICCCLPLAGCGDSDEPTTTSVDELDQYVESHAAEMAEDARIEAEEEAEEDSEEDEE
jgi:hypothetical protein